MTALRAPLKLAGVVALLWTTILLGLVPQSLLDRDSAQSLVYSVRANAQSHVQDCALCLAPQRPSAGALTPLSCAQPRAS